MHQLQINQSNPDHTVPQHHAPNKNSLQTPVPPRGHRLQPFFHRPILFPATHIRLNKARGVQDTQGVAELGGACEKKKKKE